MADSKTWISQLVDEWALISGAPILAATLVVIVAGVVWWFAKILSRSEVNGLRAQISALQESAKVLEQRLTLAKEQEQMAAAARHEVESSAIVLQRNVEAGLNEEVKADTKSLLSRIMAMKSTQTALEKTLDVAAKAAIAIVGL